MIKVALTGGIATGKSHVLEQFRRLGIASVDADELAHGVMSAGTEATAAIAARFGAEVLAADGSVDRSRLGPVVFADSAARRDLERIVHPAVYRAIAAAFNAFARLGHRIGVADIPLLFESGHAADFDRVIVTACPVEVQLQRLLARGMTEAQARQRLAAQWSTDEKASRADFVIRTDGTYADTEEQLVRVAAELQKAASATA